MLQMMYYNTDTMLGDQFVREPKERPVEASEVESLLLGSSVYVCPADEISSSAISSFFNEAELKEIFASPLLKQGGVIVIWRGILSVPFGMEKGIVRLNTRYQNNETTANLHGGELITDVVRDTESGRIFRYSNLFHDQYPESPHGESNTQPLGKVSQLRHAILIRSEVTNRLFELNEMIRISQDA